MTNRILFKIIGLFIVLFGVTIMSFVFVHVSPIDSAEVLAQRLYTRPTSQQVEELRHEMGMDKPLTIQYIQWVRKVTHGDFGISLMSKKPVTEEIYAKMAATLKIVILSMVFMVTLMFPISIYSAKKKSGIFDKVIHGFTIFALSSPNYWIGFMLLVIFSVKIPIFKVVDYGNFKSLVLPALAIALPMAASGIRVFRSELIKAYCSDYVLYARARGLGERKITYMALREALPPIVTLLMQSLAFSLAGSAAVEAVFSWPGIGSLLINAILARDLPVINACVFIMAIIVVILNFSADIINMVLNPMIAIRKEGVYD